jgi:hypothetical protein
VRSEWVFQKLLELATGNKAQQQDSWLAGKQGFSRSRALKALAFEIVRDSTVNPKSITGRRLVITAVTVTAAIAFEGF